MQHVKLWGGWVSSGVSSSSRSGSRTPCPLLSVSSSALDPEGEPVPIYHPLFGGAVRLFCRVLPRSCSSGFVRGSAPAPGLISGQLPQRIHNTRGTPFMGTPFNGGVVWRGERQQCQQCNVSHAIQGFLLLTYHRYSVNNGGVYVNNKLC